MLHGVIMSMNKLYTPLSTFYTKLIELLALWIKKRRIFEMYLIGVWNKRQKTGCIINSWPIQMEWNAAQIERFISVLINAWLNICLAYLADTLQWGKYWIDSKRKIN